MSGKKPCREDEAVKVRSRLQRTLRGWPLAAAAGLALLATARTAAAWSPSCESAQRYTLSNGLEVVLVPEPRLPTVALVSSVHAGSRDDPKGHRGLAHYVEHLTFIGAPPFASAMDLYEEVGATGLNATTTPDTTDYYALVPSSQLERALWIEARRLAVGVSALTEEQATAERRVLLREHASRFGYVPAYSLLQSTYAELYPTGHPYHDMFASEDSIEGLTLGDARWFFAEHYRTDRARLVLVGDFAPDAAKALIEKYFGALPAPAALAGAASSAAVAGASAPGDGTPAPEGGACRWAKIPRPLAHERIVQETWAKAERFELYWPATPGENTEVLRSTFSSLAGQLSQALRQTQLSNGVDAELVELELGAFWSIRIDVAAGQPIEKIEPLVARVLQAGAGAPSTEDVTAKQQAEELSDQLARERLLGRARALARRDCEELTCVDASKLAAAIDPQHAARFALASALVVERRHSLGASEGGDLEVMP
jgi:hypothetical protein